MFAFSTAPTAAIGRPSVRPRALCQRSSSMHGAPTTIRSRNGAARITVWVMKTGVFFATTTGNTQDIAEQISQKLNADACKEISEVSPSELSDYDTIVVGAPTWNTGADEQRSGTEMDDFIYGLDRLSLAGKSVACFGLGDAVGYGEYFCDALGEVYDQMATTGATMIGLTDADHIDFAESKSVRDGKFKGLAIDVVNEDGDDIEKWMSDWCAQVQKEAKVAV